VSREKIDRVKMSQMLRSGKPQKEIAEYFGVSEGAVSKAKKELNIAVVKNLALENAGRVVDKNLNTIDQLQKINDRANELLDNAMEAVRGNQKVDGKDPRELALKAMAEIRGQINLQLEIFKNLYDMRAFEEFQEEVVTIIGEVDPNARREIISRIKSKSPLRSALRSG
jgi:hypothetical protein